MTRRVVGHGGVRFPAGLKGKAMLRRRLSPRLARPWSVGLAVVGLILLLAFGSSALAGPSLDAPSDVVVTDTAGRTVTVAWAPVSNAVGYDVYVNGNKWAWNRGTNNITAELRWLDAGDPIEIGVQAVRSADVASAVTTIDAVVGGVAAPGDPQVTAGVDRIDLDWQPVADDRVVSYDVWRRQPGETSWRWSAWTRGTDAGMSGLEPDTAYELIVTAKITNRADLGTPQATLPQHAAVITISTDPVPAPPAPSRLAPVADLRATDATETSITVEWASSDDDRRRSFDLFVDGQWIGWIDDPAASSYRFDGLSAGQSYTLGVTAVGSPDDDWSGPHYSERRTIAAETATLPTPTTAPPTTAPPTTAPPTTVPSTTTPPTTVPPTTAPPTTPPPTTIPPPGNGIGSSAACRNSTEALCVEWPHGFVQAGGDQVVEVNGLNVLDWFTDNGWRYNVGQLAGADAPDFDTIRLVISWAQMQRSPGTSHEASMDALDAMIADAADNGFSVILDPIHTGKTRNYQWQINPGSAWNMPAWAWEEAGIAPAPSRDSQTSDLYNCGAGDVIAGDSAYRWLAEVVERYADNDAVVAIDLVNEPRNSCWGRSGQPANATAAAQELVDLQLGWIERLRAIDGDKVFIVTPMYGDFDTGRLDLGPLSEQPNVMWTVHDYYAGHSPDGTFYRSSGLVNTQAERSEICGTSCYRYGVADRAARQTSMANYIELHLAALAPYEIPLFIGEYGYHGTIGNHRDALADKHELYEAYGLPRTAWVANYDAAFQLYSGGAWHPNADQLTGGAHRR